VRLYVLDGGTLHVTDPSRFQLTKDDVAELNLSVGCYLVTHPRGTLLWDTCAIPDSEWTYTGSPVKHHLVLPDKQERDFTLVKPLTMQLADAGHSRATITHLALSHYHYDHTANANLFPKAAWLVTDVEREAMFAVPPPRVTTRPSTYEGLRNGGIIRITGDDHDVFGDGTVVIKAARGHTEGHQVLYVKLARTGGVVLAGDLYHYPEERTLDRVPTFEFDAQQTRAARKSLDRFLIETKAQLWIQHDFNAHAKLKKAPEYYD
jgi:glyoxylase-like metal-dependent hydrolase (beta-lactamase superfamily II)